MSDPERLFLFLHLPKTGGTTFTSVLLRQFESVEQSDEAIRVMRGGQHSEPHMAHLAEQVQQALEQGRPIAAVAGHFLFGKHLHRYTSRPVEYYTLFREPVSRVLSHYKHFRMRRPEVSLAQFVERRYLQNVMTRSLVVSSLEREPRRISSAMMLDEALENLETFFPCFGLTEFFDESLILLKRRLDWQTPLYVRENVGAPAPELLTEAIRTRILEVNALDVQFYGWAKNRFEALLAQQPPDFFDKLVQFRQANSQTADPASR